MTIIAITSELGSLGAEIASGVSHRLALRHVRYSITGVGRVTPDQARNLLNEALHRRAPGPPLAAAGPALPAPRSMTELEIIECAMPGHVLFEGFGAGIVLGPVGHLVRVRVCAPAATRAARLMRQLGLSDRSAAEKLIEAADRAAAASAARHLAADWRSPLLYDLTLNTDRLDVEAGIGAIVGFAGHASFAPDRGSHLTLEDLRLETMAYVCARLAPLDTELAESTAEPEAAPAPARSTEPSPNDLSSR